MAACASHPPLVRAVSARSSPLAGTTVATASLFPGHGRPSPSAALRLIFSPSSRPSAVAVARRRKNSSSAVRKQPPKHKIILNNGDEKKDDIDEDAFEALFSQLEEDLKNDNLIDANADDEITEDDIARLEDELMDALGDDDLDEVPGDFASGSDDEGDKDDEDDKEMIVPKLKNWQLRRLAHALKIGRRKTSIKNLSAELGLDRALVLELLREPPPNLLLMCASIPDEVMKTRPESERDPEPVNSPPNTSADVTESKPKPEAGAPVHIMQTRWTMQKRLKKVQVETLERVYSRTKRPTRSMVSSIVHVTNLPWKRVVQWFEEKRLEDGVPERRVPYKRSLPETISR